MPIRKLEIFKNDETGKVNCENNGNFTDEELVGMFECLKHLYLANIMKKAQYLPNFIIGSDFDSDIDLTGLKGDTK